MSEYSLSAVQLSQLKKAVGKGNLLTNSIATKRFRMGFRYGGGNHGVVAVPSSLLEMWRVVQYCVAENIAIIMQAANTGLTGGSTPHGNEYDRPLLIISTRRLKGIYILGGGEQVVCLPGASLYELEDKLSKFNRDPHSVIGSSCIGASVVGGVCNNSGGALISRGPAYTEYAVFARVNEYGELELVNHLGIDLGSSPEEILVNLESGTFKSIHHTANACDRGYESYVRDVTASTPARYNADKRNLFEASGSAGKVVVFAVRLDTFPKTKKTTVFYIGTNDPSDFSNLRTSVLSQCKTLPISAEYIHRDAFKLAENYGKDIFLAIKIFGSKNLQFMFKLMWIFDSLMETLFTYKFINSHMLLQFCSNLFPSHISKRIRNINHNYEHQLLVKIDDENKEEFLSILANSISPEKTGYFECSSIESNDAFLHRFAVANAAIRYQVMHGGELDNLIALDVALPRNCEDWFEKIPQFIEDKILLKIYYGHFFCYVFHQDYIVKAGENGEWIKSELLKNLDRRGAEYPAEHNVGHLYKAKPDLADFYQELDPCNCFNPGIGQTKKSRRNPRKFFCKEA